MFNYVLTLWWYKNVYATKISQKYRKYCERWTIGPWTVVFHITFLQTCSPKAHYFQFNVHERNVECVYVTLVKLSVTLQQYVRNFLRRTGLEDMICRINTALYLDSVQVMHRISEYSIKFTFPINWAHFSYFYKKKILDTASHSAVT